MTDEQRRAAWDRVADEMRAATRADDEEILHAMRFLGTDNPEHAARWLAEQEADR
jgi:hypothetical protein